MSLKEYLIYRHVAPNGKSYVGITSLNNPKQRWGKNGVGYKSSPLFSKAIEKYGWENFKHEILEEHVPTQKIDERERYWIAYYKSNDRKFGYNIEAGGCSHKEVSEETRKKLSAVHKGKPKSAEHRKKLSLANLGHHNTPEAEAKRIAKRIKPVLQFDKKGNFLNEFSSILEAATVLNIDNSGISKVCKGKAKTCGGFIWKYKEAANYGT